MFSVIVETSFVASHSVIGVDGAAEPLHSHSWQVTAELSSPNLDNNNMVIDFIELKAMLSDIYKPLRDTNLNLTAQFAQMSPTAELLAKYIYQQLSLRLQAAGDSKIVLNHIIVAEAPKCWAKYSQSP